MANMSFTKARPVTVSVPSTRRLEPAFDPALTYNTIIKCWENKPETNIYTIDPVSILEKLENDDLDSLTQLTLGCQIRKDSAVVWDVTFNTLRRNSLISCLFVANEHYFPIVKTKVIMHSQFLDQERAISRLQENIVDKGDKIGITIYNDVNQKTYVLLYTVTSHCVTQHLNIKEDARRARTSGINLTLDHVYCIGDADDSGVRVDVNENVTPCDNAHTFVEWLATCANNTKIIYPWKPHFLPTGPRAYNRELIEQRLQTSIENATEITYDDFEEICRSVYNKIRYKRSASLKNNNHNKESDSTPKEKIVYEVPELEILDLGDSNRIFARIINHNGNRGYIFDKPTDVKTKIVERFLLNEDLENRILSEVSGIFITAPMSGDKPYILRSLTVNF